MSGFLPSQEWREQQTVLPNLAHPEFVEELVEWNVLRSKDVVRRAHRERTISTG